MKRQFIKNIFILLFFFVITGFCFAQSPNNFIIQNGVLVQYWGNQSNVIIPANLGIIKIGDRAFISSHMEVPY